MPTNRTGLAPHRHFRRAVIRRAQHDGITHCPACGTELDYQHSRTPASAEADHIIPASLGGKDTPDNGRVLCRRCNQSRGNGTRKRTPGATPITITRTKTSDTW